MTPKPIEPEKERNAPVWIKFFVAFHIIAITMWALPNPKKPYMMGTARFGVSTQSPGDFVRTVSETTTQGLLYLNWRYLKLSPLMYYPGSTGFWQFWDMFSPDPASIDLYLTAEVTYQDGKVANAPYPRIHDLPLPEKYLKERYRKFFENANMGDQTPALPYVAQRIALQCFDDPNDPPVKVKLIRNSYTISPPGKAQPDGYKHEVIYEGKVDLAKLRKDKGLAP